MKVVLFKQGDMRADNYDPDKDFVIQVEQLEPDLAGLFTIVVSDTVIATDPTIAQTQSSTPVPLLSIQLSARVVAEPFPLRVSFKLKSLDGSAGVGYAQVYRNGVAVGSPVYEEGYVSYVVKTADISGWSRDDIVQVYGWRTSLNGSCVKDLVISGTVAIASASVVS